MKIAKVKISNILGLEEFSCEAGTLNLVRGANGQGKSSFIRALVGALGSGSQAKLLRNETDKGEIVLLFEDGVRFQAKVSPDKIERKAWDAEGIEIPRIATWLKERLDSVAFNPVKFLRGTPEDRLSWLLSIAPLHLDAATLQKACPAAELPAGSTTKEGEVRDPLKVLSALDTQMRERRTMIGRESKKKKAMADELETTIPAGTAEDGAGVLAGLRSQLASVQSERQLAAKKIDDVETGCLYDISTALGLRETQLRKDAQVAIDRINAQLISDLGGARYTADNEKENIRQEAKEARGKRLGSLQAKETALAEDVARQEQIAKQQDQANTTRALIKQAKAEVADHDKRYKALSESISALDEVRLSLFQSMPIKGLAVKDGAILVDDVDYETLNGANQVRVAFQLAKAASPGGIVCLDGGLSELDNRHREYFEEWAENSGLQLFLTEVADDGTPLNVTDGKAPAMDPVAAYEKAKTEARAKG